MLREIIEYGKNIREEMKATLSEIKKNPQGTNSEGKEPRIQINVLEHKEEINIQLEQNEETRIFKKQEFKTTLGHLQMNQHLIHRGARRKEEEQEIENFFEKIMKESFPNLVKEIDIQVQEEQKVPNKLDPQRNTLRYIIFKMPKVKDTENLTSSRRKAELPTKEFP